MTFLTQDGQKISYELSGNPEKSPMVFIHGFPFSGDMWAPQVEVLKADFRILTYDLRGLGKSSAQTGPFTMEILVDDLIQLLDDAKISSAVVIGFSMGGYLALRAMERNPERFKALVLVDTKSGADGNEAKLKRSDAIKMLKSSGLSPYADSFLKSAMAPQNFEKNPAMLKTLREIILKNSVEGVVASLFAMLSRTDTTASLSQIKVPTLILVGEKDSVTPLAEAEALKKAIAGSQLKIISQAGHMSPIENPKEVNAAIAQFLKQVS